MSVINPNRAYGCQILNDDVRVTVAVERNGEWVTLSDFPLRAICPDE